MAVEAQKSTLKKKLGLNQGHSDAKAHASPHSTTLLPSWPQPASQQGRVICTVLPVQATCRKSSELRNKPVGDMRADIILATALTQFVF